jgi:hypothetical protein
MVQQRQRMTLAEWQAEGARRFGADHLQWRFVCPACGHEQAVIDFRPFKDQGATTNDAFQQCIGRFAGTGDKQPCDWAAFGLFDITPIHVVEDDGRITKVFGFAEPAQEARASEVVR